MTTDAPRGANARAANEERPDEHDVLPPEAAEVVPDEPRGAGPLPARLAANYARGLVMGSADLVPGVSGGTMALVTGIYERLVIAVREFTGLLPTALSGNLRHARVRARGLEWSLFIPVLLGMLSAIAIGSGIVPALIEEYPERTNALFFGLILGSIPIPWKLVERHGAREYGLAAVAAVAAFILVGLPERAAQDPSMLAVFIAASIAICAMVLPGVSGSFLLLVLGMYAVTLDAVHDRNLAYIGVFALGAIAGLTVFTRLLGWLLANWHATTMAVLVGLMVGSLRALWPWMADDRTLLAPSGGAAEIAIVAGFGLAGLAIVVAIERIALRR